MSNFAKLFSANAIAIAGLGAAAVALSSPAAADPAAVPAVPGVPALSMIQDIATNPASVGAVLQTAASALNGASTMVGAPAPSTLPVSPIQGAPATPPVPTPQMGPASGLVPLLNQFGVPAQLVNLAPTQLLGFGPGAPVAPAAAAPVAPIAAYPTAPFAPTVAAPTAAPVNPLALITALP